MIHSLSNHSQSIQRISINQNEYLAALTALSCSKRRWMIEKCCGKIVEINLVTFIFEKLKGFFGQTDRTRRTLVENHVIKFIEHGYAQDLLTHQGEKIQKIAQRMGWINPSDPDLIDLIEKIKTPLEIKIDFIKNRLVKILKREKKCALGSYRWVYQKWLEKLEWKLIPKENFEAIESSSRQWEREWESTTIQAKQILQKSVYSEEYFSELCEFTEKLITRYEDFFQKLKDLVKSNKLTIARWRRFTTQIILERGLLSLVKGHHFAKGKQFFDAFISSPIAKPFYHRETLLHLASLQQDVPLVKWLLKKGANPNVVDTTAESPLSLALIKNNTDIASLLIAHGANVHYSDFVGQSEILNSVNHENLEILKLLFEKGANLNQPTDFDVFPLELAILNFKSSEIVKFLVENGAKLDEKLPSGFTAENAAYFAQIPLGDILLAENKESVELWQRAFLANLWSVSGMSPLKGKEVKLEGGRGRVGIKEIMRLFSDFQGYFKEAPTIEFVKNILNEKSVLWNADPKECLQRFKDGDTLLFDSGYSGHCISVLYYRDYLLILNRGGASQDSTIFVQKIDRTKAHLREKDWKKLLREGTSITKPQKYFYETLPILSGSSAEDQPDPIIKIFLSFLQNYQKIGNCWIVSPKLFPLAISLISELINLKEKTKSSSLISSYFYHRKQRKILNEAYRRMYKPFTTFIRLRTLKDYLQHTIESKEKFGKEAIEPDHQLIQTIMRKYLIKYCSRFSYFKDLNLEIKGLYQKYLLLFEKKSIPTFVPSVLSVIRPLKPKMLYSRRVSEKTLLWLKSHFSVLKAKVWPFC